MKNTVTLDLDTLTSKVNNNNFLLKSITHLILISFIGLTLEFLLYIFQNPTAYDDFILYSIFGFMIIISGGVGVSYFFLKKTIDNTLSLILTATPNNDTVSPRSKKRLQEKIRSVPLSSIASIGRRSIIPRF